MNSTEDFRLRPKKDLLPIVSNLALALLVVGVLSAAFYRHRSRMEEISLSENRYLTTEWRLLQELKEQTDAQLLQKDQEIADLNERYLRLVKENASSTELHKIEAQLRQAKVEREAIATRQAEIQEEKPVPADQAWLKDLLPSENQSALAKLLQQRLEASEAERELQTLRIGILEKELVELDAAAADAARENALTRAADSARIQELESAVAAALADIEGKALAGEGPEHPGVESLGTWALVRALASSPEIRAAYPTLLESLDQYLENYGRIERAEGRREAYTAAADAVRRHVP